MKCLHCLTKIPDDQSLCPECQKKDLPKHSRMSKGKVQSYRGLLRILLGLAMLIPGFFFPYALIILIALCTVCILSAFSNVSDSKLYDCICPECLIAGQTTGAEDTYQCPRCERKSEKYRGFLVLLPLPTEPEPELVEAVMEADAPVEVAIDE